MKSLCLCVIGVLLVGTLPCRADPVQWSGNGHYYEYAASEDVVSWIEANALANSMSWMGLDGHLATITSQSENDFIRSLLPSHPVEYAGCWLGGLQLPGSPEPAGGWTWVTGEPWVYENWAVNEPNDWDHEEHWLEIYAHQGTWWGQWNDNRLWSSYYNARFVVEYEAPHGVADAGATWLLLTTALSGLIGLARRLS